MTFDLILTGGQLLDGTGTPAFSADIGIVGERIEAIGNLSRAQARRVLPLRGLAVAPGFIDTHTHSEGVLLHDPQHACGLRQGITTEIVGLDGMSWAPLSPPNFRLYAGYLGGILGDPPCEMDTGSIAISFLPGEMQEGGTDAILERLAEPGWREALRDHLENRLFAPLDPVTFSYLPRNSHLEGKTLAEAARLRETSPARTLCDLLLEEELKVGYVNAPPAIPALREAIDRDCLHLLARPDAMACSDITPLGSAPHPRCYGAFPRFLGRLRRQFGTLSLETMVQRMTDGPARRFGLTGRGRLQPGYFADLVVFDPDTVTDTATYEDPRQFPVGIHWVVVNGQVAVEGGRCTAVLAGQAVP